MSNHQYLESSKSGFSTVYVQSPALEPARHSGSPNKQLPTATWGVHPSLVTAPKLCTVCVHTHTFSSQCVNLFLQSSQSVCIYLCQPDFPEPWLEVTNFTLLFLSRPLSGPVRLTALHSRESLPVNYYQRTMAI